MPPEWGDEERGLTMYYLEKWSAIERNGRTDYEFRPIYRCPVRWPLELMLRHLGTGKYRISKGC